MSAVPRGQAAGVAHRALLGLLRQPETTGRLRARTVLAPRLGGGVSRIDLLVIAEEIRELEREAREGQRKPIEIAVAIGERLLKAKAGLRHGEFLAWLERECEYSREHAWRLMHLSRNVARVQHLDPTVSLRAALAAIGAALRPQRSPKPRSEPVELPPFFPCAIEVADAAELPLPDGLVDLIVTSPPYGLGIDYDASDDDQGYQSYLEDSQAWAAEMFRIAGQQGRLCLNVPLDITRGGIQPIYADWLASLRAAGWHYRTTVLWNKDNINDSTARGSVDSPSSPHVVSRVETILVCHKGDWNLHRVAPHNLTHEQWLEWTSGYWTFHAEQRRDIGHPAPFPEELALRCLALFSFRDAVVCDPFVGSGTTAVVAQRLGRTFYGFDHSQQYVNLARARVAKEIAA